MEPTAAEQSILATLAYFDVFSYPLTPLEVWKWQYVDSDAPEADCRTIFSDVFTLLQNSVYLRERIDSDEGFYFLRSSESSVATRKERYLLAERKYQRVQHALRAFRYLPFIRCIAVCNTLAYSNTRDDGDLDLLVITEPGRIWTARMLATSLAQFLGWRPDLRHTRDAICLSFFLAEDAFDLQSIALTPDDRYLCYWLDQLVPLYGDASVVDALREKNQWYRKRLSHAYGTLPARRRIVTSTPVSTAVKSVLRAVHAGSFGKTLERRYEQIQRHLLPDRLRDMANKDTRVVVSDGMLKFHDNDRRAAFAQQFATRLASVQ